MKEIKEVQEIQEYALKLLTQFHDFCESNNLRYTLAYGTLLGAVRHKGFIPWDDDVDVIMPRPDYERFLKLTAENGIGHNTAVIWPGNMEKPYFPYAKAIDTTTILHEDIWFKNESGLFIDIFPMDGVPSDRVEAERHIKKCMGLVRQLFLCTLQIKKGRNLFTTCLKALVLPAGRLLFNPKKIISKIDMLSKECSFDESENAAIVAYGYGVEEITVRDKFWNRTMLKFEDKMFYVPGNYDEVLTALYGDYMTPPPVEKRISTHGFEAFEKPQVK